MNRKRTTALKVLLFIVPALILALVLQPASAVAEDVVAITYSAGDAGFFNDGMYTAFEQVTAGTNPAKVPGVTGISGFEFKYWTADVGVYLNDGTYFFAGTPIRPDQIGNVVVSKDTSFTAGFWRETDTQDGYCLVAYTAILDGPGDISAIAILDTTSEKYILLDTSPYLHPPKPAVSTDMANTFRFASYWTADVDLITWEGTTATAGTHITPRELEYRYPLQGDVTFTAHYTSTKATVTYKTDGHGTLDNSSESVNLDTTRELVDSTETLTVGRPTVGNDNPQPDAGYEFAYWTADKDVYVLFDGKLMREEAEHTTFQPEDIVKTLYVAEDTTYTAHFKRTAPCSVTYKSAGNGSVNPTSESVAVGSTPKGPTITPNTGFEFDYWTASAEVYFIDGQGNVTQFDVDDPISADEFVQLSIEDDITFTAHFKQTSVDPEPEPVNPDGGDTIKPADGEGGKLTPKTGDTLPGATAAVALGAGVVVAGAALLKKRCR